MREYSQGDIIRSRYQFVQKLGEGGFAHTYLAADIDRPGHPPCVIKQLKGQIDPSSFDQARRLFNQEAEILAKLYQRDQANHIPELLAYFEQAGDFFLVQEFIDGHTLSEEFVTQPIWPESDVVHLLKQILIALSSLHQHHVIHRDLKPDNIIRRARDGKIFLIDFGAVKQGETTGLTIAIGTVGYMPPEQIAGQPRLASDIYALGLIGIQALTGLSPGELHQLENVDNGSVQHTISEPLADFLHCSIALDLNTRYVDAFDALRHLPDPDTSTKPVQEIDSPTPYLRPLNPVTAATAIAVPSRRSPTPETSTPPIPGKIADTGSIPTETLESSRSFNLLSCLLWLILGTILIFGSGALAFWLIRSQLAETTPAADETESAVTEQPPIVLPTSSTQVSPEPLASPSPSPSPSATAPTLGSPIFRSTPTPTPSLPTSISKPPPLPPPTQPEPTIAPPTTLTLRNETVSEDICELYIWPVNSSNQGENLLHSRIHSGTSRNFEIPAGQYNLLTDNCGPGSMQRINGAEVDRDRTWTIREGYNRMGFLD